MASVAGEAKRMTDFATADFFRDETLLREPGGLGAPLVRSEGRVAIERLLARTSGIRVSERAHGPAGARRFDCLPSFVLRGLTSLTLEFDPAS